MNRQTDRCKARHRNGQTNIQTNGRTNKRTDERTDGRTNEGTDKRTDVVSQYPGAKKAPSLGRINYGLYTSIANISFPKSFLQESNI